MADAQEGLRLDEVCAALRRADPDIVEIVQFGSSVYAPDLARDVDLLVTTAKKKEDDCYDDAVDRAGCPLQVELVTLEVGERLHALARMIWPLHRVLYGSGEWLKEEVGGMAFPEQEEIEAAMRSGQTNFRFAAESANVHDKHQHYRTAFNALFDAARLAAMRYLGTEQSRWGQLRRELPAPHSEEFREIIRTVHLLYFYEGKYPRETVQQEFDAWRSRVARFIRLLSGSPSA
jgi:succinate dehydrogenase/fumarate reductase flavoprotein subunit